MQHMRTGRYIFGVASLLAGLALLVPAAVLLNLRLKIFPVSWGITDIQVGTIRLSDSLAECLFGVLGIVLLFFGSVLLGKRPGSAA